MTTAQATALSLLMQHEVDAICAALRRDMRQEEERAKAKDGYEDEHQYNARMNKSILELLMPKAIHPTGVIHQQAAA